MKRILCALFSCVLFSSFAVGLTGCGCSKNQEPGYRIEETTPDLKNDTFGFFIINNNELMLTKYMGSDEDVTIPDSYNNYKVTAIGTSVFSGTEIKSIVIPDTVKEIKDYAFYNCKNLTSITLSKNLEILGTNVFNLCRSLESIEIPSSVKDLGTYTFSASGLKSITIPESKTLTKISYYVFFQCQKLTEVTLPSTVTLIEKNAISDCPNKITIKAPDGSYAQKYANDNNFNFEKTE